MAKPVSVDELVAALDAGQNVDGWTLPTYSRELRDQTTISPVAMGAHQQGMVASEQRAKLAARLAPYQLRYRLVISFREETRKSGRGYSRRYWPIGWWTTTIRVGWWDYKIWRLRRWLNWITGADDPAVAEAIVDSLVATHDEMMRP